VITGRRAGPSSTLFTTSATAGSVALHGVNHDGGRKSPPTSPSPMLEPPALPENPRLTCRGTRSSSPSPSSVALNGVQSVFTTYFVTYLVALGYELGAAGFLFSVVVAVAVPCRVLWAGSAVSTSGPVS